MAGYEVSFGPVPLSPESLPAYLPAELGRLADQLNGKFADLDAEDGKKTLAASGTNSVTVADTRDDADTPSHFETRGLWVDFKFTSNTQGGDGHLYTGQMVLAPWGDDFGGGVHAFLFGGNGKLEHSFGTRAGGWSWTREIPRIIRAEPSLGFLAPGSVPGKVDSTVSVAGCEVGDQVSIVVPAADRSSNHIFDAWVSVAGTVTIRCWQLTGAAAAPGAGGTYKIMVTK